MSDNPERLDSNAIDAINLAQALRDVEQANARVLDLTRRLLDSERQRRMLADELERLRLSSRLFGPSPTAKPGSGQAVPPPRRFRAAARALKALGRRALQKPSP